jgi:hypothetical protein
MDNSKQWMELAAMTAVPCGAKSTLSITELMMMLCGVASISERHCSFLPSIND